MAIKMNVQKVVCVDGAGRDIRTLEKDETYTLPGNIEAKLVKGGSAVSVKGGASSGSENKSGPELSYKDLIAKAEGLGIDVPKSAKSKKAVQALIDEAEAGE